MEIGETPRNLSGERKFSYEASSSDGQVTLKPKGPLVYFNNRKPLASEYHVTIPAELAPFEKNPFLSAFLDKMVKHMAGNAEVLSFCRQGKSLPESYYTELQTLSRHLSPYMKYLTPDLRQNMEAVTFDFNGAWETVPPISDDAMPNLWMARFFGIKPEKIYIGNTHFPKIKLWFLQGEYDDNALRSFYYGNVQAIEKAFSKQGVLPIYIGKETEAQSESHEALKKLYEKDTASLTELVNGDWPNATYAVDSEAKSWKCPIIAVDQQEENQGIYNMYAKTFRDRVADGDKRIIVLPLLNEAGLPTISNEVVAGPPVSENGFKVMIPGSVPNEKFKKIIARVINQWVSLQALDYYTVTEDNRAFLSFDWFSDHLKTEEDKKLWSEFCQWMKEKDLRVSFIDPISFREYLTTERKSKHLN